MFNNVCVYFIRTMMIVDDRCKCIIYVQRTLYVVNFIIPWLYIMKLECFSLESLCVLVLNGFPVDLSCSAKALVGLSKIKFTYLRHFHSTDLRSKIELNCVKFKFNEQQRIAFRRAVGCEWGDVSKVSVLDKNKYYNNILPLYCSYTNWCIL